MNNVSEEQVLFNKLRWEDRQLIIKIMKTLQPCEIKCEVKEDKDIPLIPDDELFLMKQNGADIRGFDYLDYNFKVLKEKINQVAEEFNEYRKENK